MTKEGEKCLKRNSEFKIQIREMFIRFYASNIKKITFTTYKIP